MGVGALRYPAMACVAGTAKFWQDRFVEDKDSVLSVLSVALSFALGPLLCVASFVRTSCKYALPATAALLL